MNLNLKAQSLKTELQLSQMLNVIKKNVLNGRYLVYLHSILLTDGDGPKLTRQKYFYNGCVRVFSPLLGYSRHEL